MKGRSADAAADRLRLRQRLMDKLAESLSTPLAPGTLRRIWGRMTFRGKATAVVGMRRAGKTTFLHQVRSSRLKDGTDRVRLPYINFEDEQLAEIGAEDLHLLVEGHYRQFPGLRGKETVTWCFDEIQTVPGWERFVRRLLDEEKVEVFVSGSSAALLSREIATAMRGRAWEVRLLPFSFEETLRHRELPVPGSPGFLTPGQRSGLERAFLEYLAQGGFPEAVGLDEGARRRLLQDYVDVAMMRDVVERHRVANVVGLRWLVRHMLGNAGAMFSAEKFFAALKSQGVSIAKDTVHQLVAHLEDCFLVRTVWMEAASERQRMVNPRKAYPVDPGLIPVFDRSGRSNIGHVLETAVMLELERRGAEITYVRTAEGFEVDFLARLPGGGAELIQVAADATAPETAERELRALEAVGRQYPKAARRLLTLTRDGLPDAVPAGILAQPAYEWLLAKPATPSSCFPGNV